MELAKLPFVYNYLRQKRKEILEEKNNETVIKNRMSSD